MLGEIHDVRIGDGQVAELREAMSGLPVHHDAPPALSRLRHAGFVLTTFTNSAPSSNPDGLDRAGLGPLFSRRFTVEPTQRFKPHPATYQSVVRGLGVQPADACLIAAHTWDTIGAPRRLAGGRPWSPGA